MGRANDFQEKIERNRMKDINNEFKHYNKYEETKLLSNYLQLRFWFDGINIKPSH